VTGDASTRHDRRAPSLNETQRFLLLAVLIGIFAGLLIVCFHVTIEMISWRTIGILPGAAPVWTIMSPAIGAALAAFIVLVGFPAAHGSGVNYTKSALFVSNGYIPFSTVVGKFIACSISLGSGVSLGPEDPALQMGAGLASWLGRAFRLPREHLRLVAPVGAAAAIGAAFNTPITAVLFTIEEIVGAWNTAVLGSIVLASVSAVVTTRVFLGDAPLFRVPVAGLAHPSELLVHAAVGIVAGLLAVAFIRTTARLKRVTAHRDPRQTPIMAFAAGLVVGVVAIWVPQVAGVGYATVDSALHNQYTWQWLMLIAAAKVVVTVICFSAGAPGGMFAPVLFVGAMIGGASGALAHAYWPLPTAGLSTYVLVGMGAFFCAVFRAPMTSTFMVFELSASYVVVLPVLVANTLAYLVSRQFQRQNFFDAIAGIEGVTLPSQEVTRETRPLRVEDALPEAPPILLDPALPASEAATRLEGQSRIVLVGSDKGPWRPMDPQRLAGAIDGQTLDHVLTSRPLPVVHPDQSLDAALRVLGPHGMLAVSRRSDGRLLGAIAIDDILNAYGIAGRRPPDPGPDSQA
jgi:CIC family chloride channel protein